LSASASQTHEQVASSNRVPAGHVIPAGHSQAQVAGLHLRPGPQPPQSAGQAQAHASASGASGKLQLSLLVSHAQPQVTGSSFCTGPHGVEASHLQAQLAVSHTVPGPQPPQSARQTQPQVPASAC
jgi:hypothetical protein